MTEYEQTARRRRLGKIGTLSLVAVDLILLLACANVAGLLLGRAEARRPRWPSASRSARSRTAARPPAADGVGAAVAGWRGHRSRCWRSGSCGWCRRSSRRCPSPSTSIFASTCASSLGRSRSRCWPRRSSGCFPALARVEAGRRAAVEGRGAGHVGRREVAPRITSLVVGQIAVSLALLVSSALLTRSFLNQRRDRSRLRTAPDGVLDDGARRSRIRQGVRTREFYRRLLERLAATPGVGAGDDGPAPAAQQPVRRRRRMRRWSFPGSTRRPADRAAAVPLQHRGDRLLRHDGDPAWSARSRVSSRATARKRRGSSLINQTMARRFWPDEDPIGPAPDCRRRSAARPSRRDCEIVGVVQDGKYLNLNEPPEPYLYLPYAQQPRGEMTVIARVSTDRAARWPRSSGASWRTWIAAMPIMQVTTIDEHMQTALVGQRAAAVSSARSAGSACCCRSSGSTASSRSSCPGGRGRLASGWRSAPVERTSSACGRARGETGGRGDRGRARSGGGGDVGARPECRLRAQPFRPDHATRRPACSSS